MAWRICTKGLLQILQIILKSKKSILSPVFNNSNHIYSWKLISTPPFGQSPLDSDNKEITENQFASAQKSESVKSKNPGTMSLPVVHISLLAEVMVSNLLHISY